MGLVFRVDGFGGISQGLKGFFVVVCRRKLEEVMSSDPPRGVDPSQHPAPRCSFKLGLSLCIAGFVV